MIYDVYININAFNQIYKIPIFQKIFFKIFKILFKIFQKNFIQN